MSLVWESAAARNAAALFEFGCVFWVDRVGKAQAWQAGACSMFLASCELIALARALPSGVVMVFYVVGYGMGSFVGVLLAKRLPKPPRSRVRRTRGPRARRVRCSVKS